MLKEIAFFSIVCIVISCSSAPVVYDRSEWPAYGYPAFSKKINATSGADAINCGFYDLIHKSKPNGEKAWRESGQCIQYAVSAKQPFKVGSVRIPTDSYLYEILVFSPKKEYWLITLDAMVDGSDTQQRIKRCQNITFSSRHLLYEGVDCLEVSNDSWWPDLK